MLTQKAKYALYALQYIAIQPPEFPIKSSEISKEKSIPKKFLETILSELVRSEILVSKMGQQGGYVLNRPPKDINVAEVIRLFDGAIALLPCATYTYFKPCEECLDVDLCKIRHTFKELRDLSVEFLKSKTIQDLV